MRLLKFLLLLLGLAVLAGCAAPCDEQVAAFAVSADDIVNRYDALIHGDVGGNVAFGVRALQEEANKLEVPTCGNQSLGDAIAGADAALTNLIDNGLTAATVQSYDDLDATLLAEQEARATFDERMQELYLALETTE